MLLIIYFHVLRLFLSGIENPQSFQKESSITGVYQGKTLFIQNPYSQETQAFCVEKIFVNGVSVNYNPRQSAIKVDFVGIDLYSPVYLRIVHSESCAPLIINPDAIAYHNSFRFAQLNLVDTLLTWKSQGEQEEGYYIIEKIDMGTWIEQDTIQSKGKFGGSSYEYIPALTSGPNKFRVKYIFPNQEYLNSRDLDIHFYPSDVTFQPSVTDSKLFLSRGSEYKIYDSGGKLMLSGQDSEIDVSSLPVGEYLIYFKQEYPGFFQKK
ncbi:MAG: hypothetical protein RIA69_14810 [Cyclobacteriaceae bacterium]